MSSKLIQFAYLFMATAVISIEFFIDVLCSTSTVSGQLFSAIASFSIWETELAG